MSRMWSTSPAFRVMFWGWPHSDEAPLELELGPHPITV